jgi:hypothetical protein
VSENVSLTASVDYSEPAQAGPWSGEPSRNKCDESKATLIHKHGDCQIRNPLNSNILG